GELDRERPELLHGQDQAARRADLRDLLDRDQRQQRARPEAAVDLRKVEPEQAVLPEDLDHVPRKLVRLVDLRGTRGNTVVRERAHEITDLELLPLQSLKDHSSA